MKAMEIEMKCDRDSSKKQFLDLNGWTRKIDRLMIENEIEVEQLEGRRSEMNRKR